MARFLRSNFRGLLAAQIRMSSDSSQVRGVFTKIVDVFSLLIPILTLFFFSFCPLFRQKEREALSALKKHHEEEIDHHKKEIERLQREIDRRKGQIRKLKHDD
nr:PREDICTED: ATPase inhibitor, mitochondrial [Lepisosteus oculatus]